MPRIRTIKPEFWKSEAIAAHPHRTRLTFIGLWTYVDDNGVGIDNEKLITAELYPLEEDPREALANVREDLARLHAGGRILRYVVDGKRYLAIVGWDHQKIDKPGRPRYPLPTVANAEHLTSDNAAAALVLVPPSRDPRDTLATVHRLEQVAVDQGSGDQLPSSSHQAALGDDDEPADADEEAPPDDEHDADHDGDETGGPIPEDRREDVERVCRHLSDEIHARRRAAGSKQRRPAVTQAWRLAAWRLINVQSKTVEQIIAAIDWCQQDEFWATRIESMPKLRIQYEKLQGDAKRRPAGQAKPAARTHPLDDRKAMLGRAMDRARAKEQTQAAEASNQ